MTSRPAKKDQSDKPLRTSPEEKAPPDSMPYGPSANRIATKPDVMITRTKTATTTSFWRSFMAHFLFRALKDSITLAGRTQCYFGLIQSAAHLVSKG
jgi:hypothetical protein